MAGIKPKTLIEATVFPQHHLFLGKMTYDEVFETPARIPPRTGSLVVIRYPKFNVGWKADFTLIVVEDSRDLLDKVRKSLETAGRLVGVGSWRPEYGRFIVKKWKAEALKLAA